MPMDVINDKLIGSDNDLVPSGSKQLPGPMLAYIYFAILHHYATTS